MTTHYVTTTVLKKAITWTHYSLQDAGRCRWPLRRELWSRRLLMGRRGRRSSAALAGQRQWCSGNGDGGDCWLERKHYTHTDTHSRAHAREEVTYDNNARTCMMYVMRRSEARGRPCALEQSVLDHAVVWSLHCVRWFVCGWSLSWCCLRTDGRLGSATGQLPRPPKSYPQPPTKTSTVTPPQSTLPVMWIK